MARKRATNGSETGGISANLGFEAKLWLAPYKGRIYDPACGSGAQLGGVSLKMLPLAA